MQIEHIPLDETDCFSSFFVDYINKKPELKSFYSVYPTLENFQSIIENRSFDDASRVTLVNTLQKQYDGVDVSDKVSNNIKSLESNKTFTVTTGHQLNIFTGPLYFIYKIVSVINSCIALKEKYPQYNFVPVYWMASEDHDFEEINHFHFEGKKYQWDTDQNGAVGRFNLDGLKQIAEQLPSAADFFKEAYSKTTLADAARHYVNHLFGNDGIVVLDADSSDLKIQFAHIIKDDLFQHSTLKAVEQTTSELQKLGYKTQVSAREINLFYLEDGVRERIEKDGEIYKVLGTDITYSETEINNLISQHPEKFSPNVILRPLYQETILPNLAYIGGPAEVVYWLQLNSVFEYFKTPFPILMPRNFATVITEKESAKWNKTGLSSGDLFLDIDSAHAKWVKSNTSQHLTYVNQIEKLNTLYGELGKTAALVDPTLQQHLEALNAVAAKKLGTAEKKLIRAEKKKHQEKKAQINAVKEALFPNGSMQERHDNFLNFYLKDPQFIHTLLDTFDAFDFRMYLLYK